MSKITPVLLVLRSFIKRSDDGHLLLLLRSAIDRHQPGLWECPGGTFDMERDLWTAQQREVMEETGFRIERVHPLMFPDSYIISDGAYAGHLCVTLWGIVQPVGGSFQLSHEHDDYRWLSYTEMMQLNLTPQVRRAAVTLEEYLA